MNIPRDAVEAIPIEWNNLTLSWNAVCRRCRELLFMLPDEARMQPARTHVQHACFK